jgi:BMFP domain-containing protein YqiC
MTHISTNRALSRRSILKGSGVLLALPFLEAMNPVFGKGSTQTISPRRFVALNAALGFHGPNLFPEKEGRDYSSTPYLKILDNFRSDFTLFSGLSHSNQQGTSGHASEMTWLTGVERPGLAGFKNTISIDQVMAQNIGASTRFPSLNLGTGGGGQSISWDANGVSIPCQASPSKIYRELFVQGTEKEVEQQVNNLDRGKSILDVVLRDAKSLRSNVGQRDKEKLDQYFSSVRDLEVRLEQSKEWARKPKPAVSYQEPRDVQDRYDLLSRQRLMYDLMSLALKTDSTRVITFSLGAFNAVPTNIDGVKTDWHNLSHHGKDENKIDELEIIEKEEFSLFAKFLGDLKNHQENGSSLLTNTTVLFGSNLGNASSHDWRNLPIILAGGGYRHGSYVAHDAQDNTPLSNLFVPLAQGMGVEIEQFGKSTNSSLRGLES